METSRKLEEIDFLLQRNWFLDRDDVIDLLYLATYQDWDWIMKNVQRYDPNIRQIIYDEARAPFNLPKTMKVRNLTDEEYEQICLDSEKCANEIADQKWKQVKETHNLHRIPSDVDSIYKSLQEEYENEYNQAKRFGKLNQPAINAKLSELNTRIQRYADKIHQANKDWEYIAKLEYRINGTLPELS